MYEGLLDNGVSSVTIIGVSIPTAEIFGETKWAEDCAED